MDDGGIELNFATSAPGVIKRQLQPKKGGRWTDRVKAKQAVRRVVNKYEKDGGLPVAKPPPAKPPVASTPASRPVASKPASRPAAAHVKDAIVKPTWSKPASARPSQPQAEAGPSRARIEEPLPLVTGPAPAAKPAPPAKAQSQVISSLFTSNPSLPSVAAPAQPINLGAPSNAPLASDATTFQGLGLDPLLVHHLKSKLSVKAPTGIQKSCLPYMLSAPLDIHARRTEDDGDDEDDYEARTAAAAAPKEERLRDVFIQSQTGSGKTLAFLLPIIQTLLPLSRLSYIDRSIGTLAIIMAPTRELAQQISQVLENILRMALSLPGEEEDRRYTRWLVSGLLVGGSTRTHEKARLRKGVPILVSTPGRLLDHLQNTTSFQCGKTMFLVLDEADRLMDLGFEETISGILKALDGRRRNEINAEKEVDQEGGGLMRWPYWNRGRQTILCSATIDPKVERLAGMALRDPVIFRSSDKKQTPQAMAKAAAEDSAVAQAIQDASAISLPIDQDDKFTPPSQLAQKYVVTPTKLRLVTLVALVRSLVSSGAAKVQVDEDGKEGTKVIVFLSSTDSVDYHFKLLGGVCMGGPAPAEDGDESLGEDEDGNESADEGDEDGDAAAKRKRAAKKDKGKAAANADMITLRSALFPNTDMQRLHGSLPLRTRLASLKAFATPSANPSILLATSVASRGLDLPLVRAVVQYDLPTEGGASEYVHRVGRTARAGKGGEAWAFVSPSETEWVPWVEGKMGAADRTESADGGSVRLAQVGVDEVLKKGFGGRGHEFEGRATEVQLAFERWVLDGDKNAAQARKAFASFVRAYSTHPIEERRFFSVKALHLGHLAKSFALREAPGAITAAAARAKGKNKAKAGDKRKRGGAAAPDGDDGGSDGGGRPRAKVGKEGTARNETEARMYAAVRAQGRQFKAGGELGVFGHGGSDYQVVDTSKLEKLVARRR